MLTKCQGTRSVHVSKSVHFTFLFDCMLHTLCPQAQVATRMPSPDESQLWCPGPSLWSLIAEHVPGSELSKIQTALGHFLVDMYTEAHTEVRGALYDCSSSDLLLPEHYYVQHLAFKL